MLVSGFNFYLACSVFWFLLAVLVFCLLLTVMIFWFWLVVLVYCCWFVALFLLVIGWGLFPERWDRPWLTVCKWYNSDVARMTKIK